MFHSVLVLPIHRDELTRIDGTVGITDNLHTLDKEGIAILGCLLLQLNHRAGSHITLLVFSKEFENDVLNGVGELTSWSVALMSKGDGAESTHQFSNGIKVGCFVRNRAEDISDVNTYYIRKNHIVGNQCDEFIDLESTILSSALEVTKERKIDAGKEWDKTYPAPDIVRQEFRSKQNPLLIIYPLNPKCSNVLDKTGNIVEGTVQYSASDEPFIGLAISFPGSETNHAISYVVNQVGDFVETEDMFDENNDNVYAEA